MVATVIRTNVTDPVADLLTRLRNANTAYNSHALVACSRLNEAILTILTDEGYLVGFTKVPADAGKGVHFAYKAELKYGKDRERTISGLRRISKPGRRVYAKRDALPRVLGGLGIAILSTSQGVMTDRQASRKRVGGEVLGYVW